jgi:hypothetical protein
MTTEAARELIMSVLGVDPFFDGNMLNMLRAIEKAHGIE